MTSFDDREDNDQLRRILDQAAIGMAVLDERGRYVHANPALGRILGYPHTALAGLSFIDLTHPDDVDIGVNLFQALVAGTGDSYQVEKRYFHESGAIVWARLLVSLMKDAGGRPDQVIVMAEDITAQHQAEEQLEFERAHLEQLFEMSPDAMVLVDRNDCIVRINPAFTRLFGRTESESIGRPLQTLIEHESDTPEDTSCAEISADTTDPREAKRSHKDGTTIEVAELLVPVQVAGSRVAAYRIYRDITERKRAEAALRASEERFRTVIEVLGEGILITDLDDRIVYANRRTLEITGFTEAELIGRTAFEMLVPPDECARLERRMERRLRGEPERYEMRQFCKGGRTIWVEVNETPLHDAESAVIGTVAVISDITERRTTAESLEAQIVTDDLTGLANRRGFFSQAEVDWVVAMARGEAVTLIFADMDRFKDINDRFGHAEGDRALQDVAELLRSVFRPSDLVEQVSAGSTVARLGGDEFVVLLTGTDSADPEIFRRRILTALEHFNRTQGRPYQLEMSIGIKRVDPSSNLSFEAALHQADSEMYELKRFRKA